jgi:hypothetical protein
MATNAIQRRLFEADRRMELKLRLAAKRAARPGREIGVPLDFVELPEKDVLARLIDKVRRM